MYSPLNEDYMFQEMHDRVARMNRHVAPKPDKDEVHRESLPNRRWWRRAVHVAR